MTTAAHHLPVALALGVLCMLLATSACQPNVREPAGPPLREITVGDQHTCMLTMDSGVKCYGITTARMIVGGREASFVPVRAHFDAAGVVDVAGGMFHTCVLTSSGAVRCTGVRMAGRPGDGTRNNSRAPVDVVGLPADVASIAAGDFHTCATTRSGAAWCWGSNFHGQLGLGTTVTWSAPGAVTPLPATIVGIAAGRAHTCGRSTDGRVFCWGSNEDGQLGDGTNITSTSPVPVTGLPEGVSALTAGGNDTCALLRDGRVFCWGSNFVGKLGIGTTTASNVPVQVKNLPADIVAVAMAERHACALTSQGAMKCWGSNFNFGLGNIDVAESFVPVDASYLKIRATAIALGFEYTCALAADGALHCWGRIQRDPYPDKKPSTIAGGDLPEMTEVTRVFAAQYHVCALTRSQGLFCWGNDSFGQLGNDQDAYPAGAWPVPGLESGVAEIAGRYEHSCAVTDVGQVWCWGRNSSGQRGGDADRPTNRAVRVGPFPDRATNVTVGLWHSCALLQNGSVACWGNNNDFQLGNEFQEWSNLPLVVPGLPTDLVSLHAGGSYNCVLTSSGAVWCWGKNDRGQLGRGGSGSRDGHSRPAPVPGLAGVATLATGDYHACAHIREGKTYCWGDNSRKAVTDSQDWEINSPTPVSGLPDAVTSLAAGDDVSCATTADGAVYCWGGFSQGSQEPTFVVRSQTPVLIGGLESGVTRVALGSTHACAHFTSGLWKCWGDNRSGQISIDGLRSERVGSE